MLSKPIFFPEGPIHILSQFISWINLDLGIETCFFDGMDSCRKTWLQFIFPGYVWFLLILIIILLRYSSKVVRLVGRQAIPVLATMILLSYTKLICTVFLVLRYTDVSCSGENNVTFKSWYVDATAPYLKGCHIAVLTGCNHVSNCSIHLLPSNNTITLRTIIKICNECIIIMILSCLIKCMFT